MTSVDFVRDQVGRIVSAFQQADVKYQYHGDIRTHVIEVKPFDLFRKNSAYLAIEEEIVFRFIDMFPTENICFIDEDTKYLGVDNPDLERKGILAE